MKKRDRGEDEGGPQGKRAAGPRAESSEAAANQTASGQRLTTDDALAYLKAVKDKFKDDKEKYDEFLEVMKDFKAQRIDTAGVITRVKELFKGHKQLILGFNTFLPKGYEITLPLEEDKKQPAVEFDQAINYVNKIKARFQTDEQVYKAFLEILNMYRKGNKSINEVYQEVASLFENHGDLLEEFTYFLPGSTGPPITTPHPVVKPVQQNSRQRDDKSFGAGAKHSGEKLVVPKKEKSVTLHGERDRDREHERRAEKDRKKGEKDREKKETGERKERGDREEGGREKERDLDAMQRLPHKRKSARRADELIRKQSQAGEGVEGFSGPAPQASLDDKRLSKSGASSVQYPFFDKVKARLRSRDTYQEFLKCLNIFSQEIISRGELQSLVGDILGKHADLMEGFNEFLTHCENVEGYLAGVFSGRRLGDFVEETPVKAVKIEKEKETERDRDREKDRERERDRDRDRERDRAKERDRDIKPIHPIKEGSHKVSIIPSKDKYINKPISELDLSNCERCTPSYRLLPKHYPRPVSGHRTPLGNAVLNDSWVSVTSGSEDYSFKHMRKNQYEESLFRCEDDRFELDMLLELTAATAKLVGEYPDKQGDVTVKQESPAGVDEYLSAINLRCIERIYGDHGLDIIDVLRKQTLKAMPVIHTRLKQKQEEWTKCRLDMNKVWAEVYAKNCYKALDHRSFYFRQQDKKALSTKGLLAEIKEVNDKKRREDDTMLAIAAGNRRPLLPDLRFDFQDPSIHEDLYQIIKYSSEEICTSSEIIEKVMRIWTTFLEPMFGISPRPHGAEDMEEAAKVKALEPKGSEISAHDSGASEGEETPPEAVGSATDLKALLPVEEFATATSNLENYAVERLGVRHLSITNGEAQTGDAKTEGTETARVGNEAVGVENARGPGVADSVPVRPFTEGPMESNAAVPTRPSTEGPMGSNAQVSGWLPTDDAVAPQNSAAAEKPERSNPGLAESRGMGSKPEGLASLMDVDRSGVLGRGDREEGELSPSPELEDRNKMKFDSSRRLEENGLMKEFGHDDEDAEGVGGTEMDHDQDADDEGEESAQKSSEDSDNASEAGEEVTGSESGDEQSEHEEEEEEEEDEQEGKAESEGEAEGMADADDGDGDGNSSLASPDRSFALCKPLAAHAASADALVVGSHPRKDGRIFYGNDIFYVLFRLYQTLYERILSAKTNATLAAQKKTKDGAPPNLYSRFMQVLYSLLDGSVDNSKFEDECRSIIGTQSYVLFTLDKLIFKLVKQLKQAATDDVALKLLGLHAYEKAGEAVDLVYHANACVILHDENIYRFEHRSDPSELLIQLMEGGSEKLDVPGNALEVSFQNYLDDFFQSVTTTKTHRVFMARNKKRKYAKEDEDAALQSAMENVRVVNGLEYKISCHTSKVSYVLDTEDLFLRCTPLRSKGNSGEHELKEKRESHRRRSFGEWIDKRLKALNDSVSQSETSHMD